MARASGTLSGGESQRIRLASQIGSGLTGVLYVLDEPSIGLHQRDNTRLLKSLREPARPRQLGAGGGARRGGHPHRRPRHRHGPRRGRARRPHHRRGQAGRHQGLQGQHNRPVPHRRARDRRPGGAPQAQPEEASCSHPRRPRQQPERRDGGDPRGPVHLHHRGVGRRQVHLHHRDAVQGRRAPAEQRLGRAGAARQDRRPGPSSTRSSTSTRARSGAPRAPTPPPTPAPSGRSGTGSPGCRTPRRGATDRGVSASTSRAGGAKPARATG